MDTTQNVAVTDKKNACMSDITEKIKIKRFIKWIIIKIIIRQRRDDFDVWITFDGQNNNIKK